MDGVSWSATRSRESFSRSTTTTLSRLASFIARADPKQHMSNQQQQPSHLPTYVCGECGKGFSYPADLLQHQELKHTLPKPHRCPSCGKEFSLRSSLQLHKCDRDPIRCERCQTLSLLGSPCPACRTRSADPGRLQDKTHLCQPHLLDSSPYACAPCGRGFSQKQALLHHQQAGCSESPLPSNVVHAICLPGDSPPVSEGDSTRSDSSDSSGPSSRAISMCHFCSRTFRTEDALQRHTQNNHVEEEQRTKGESSDEEAGKEQKRFNGESNPKPKKKHLTCRSCDMVFRSTAKLYVHRKEKHSREKNIKREVRPPIIKHRRTGTYPCQVCSKVFFHHLSLRAHFRRHTSSGVTSSRNQALGCTTTDSKSTENTLNKEKISQGDNKTVRTGPGRPRKEPRGLSNVEDPGRCRELPDVKKEEEVEEREFPCPSCAEVFSLQWQLKEHMELHQSSVRRRQCSVCRDEMDTCKWPGSKRQRLYHCVPCQQGFSALDSFLQHCQQHL
ncbi:zinc finger protein 835 [Melanotaenia boesemani]|uniref:zinc finger protein 835 n=1 Tax=Melanotaenia boesemani TaxID=1250792 RepID=UPI001C041244|nr:zinc finger protein 835 [Melanotaenia boesemani]XP_041859169.1 zinc finger protein 835 [Melanotaenia boesemani]